MFRLRRKRADEVFGMSNTILDDSYVNRGNLDEEIQRYLKRRTHIALRGESKCGKSWLTQKNIPNALVVRCRLGKNASDIYTDALSQLGIKLILEESSDLTIKGRVEASSSFGANLLAKLGFNVSLEADDTDSVKERPIGQDINDLRYIADLIVASERRLVIEDFIMDPEFRTRRRQGLSNSQVEYSLSSARQRKRGSTHVKSEEVLTAIESSSRTGVVKGRKDGFRACI